MNNAFRNWPFGSDDYNEEHQRDFEERARGGGASRYLQVWQIDSLRGEIGRRGPIDSCMFTDTNNTIERLNRGLPIRWGNASRALRQSQRVAAMLRRKRVQPTVLGGLVPAKVPPVAGTAPRT